MQVIIEDVQANAAEQWLTLCSVRSVRATAQKPPRTGSIKMEQH